MLHDKHISVLVDYESSKDCFDGVNIAGGICYFLRDRSHIGLCRVTNKINELESSAIRRLDEFQIFIRSNVALSILRKVLLTKPDMLSNHAYPRNPFGFATNFRGRADKRPDDIEILTSIGFQYINRNEVKKNIDIIDTYKVLIGRLVPSNGELDVNPKDKYKVITDTRIIEPNQINTETYLDIGVFRTKNEALNFAAYINAKFPRFLLRQAISSLNVTKECFRFVPFLDFSCRWTDDKLYRKYGLSQQEVDLIESTIRPMDISGGDDHA